MAALLSGGEENPGRGGLVRGRRGHKWLRNHPPKNFVARLPSAKALGYYQGLAARGWSGVSLNGRCFSLRQNGRGGTARNGGVKAAGRRRIGACGGWWVGAKYGKPPAGQLGRGCNFGLLPGFVPMPMIRLSPLIRATGAVAAALLLSATAGTRAGAQVPVSPAMAAAVVQAAEPLVQSALESAAASAKKPAAQPTVPAVAQPSAELLPQATPGYTPGNLPAAVFPPVVFPAGGFPAGSLPAAVFPGSSLRRSSLPAGSMPLRPNTAALLPPVYMPPGGKTGPVLALALTTSQQKTLAKGLLTEGQDVAISPEVTAALGLTKGNETLTLRELANTDTHGLAHIYSRLPDGGVLVSYLHDDASWNYRYDGNMNFVAGVEKKAGEAPVAIPSGTAAASGAAELGYWGEYAGML